MMSEADELFRELGYIELFLLDDKIITYENKISKQIIQLDERRKEISSLSGIGIKTLKAINAKVKDLGWEE